MHSKIIHNLRLLDAAKARVPPVTAAALHGRGVFTTLAVYDSRPFMWPEHWARLAEHADRAGVGREGFDEETLGAALARLVEANSVARGRARVLLLARALRGGWRPRRAVGKGAKDGKSGAGGGGKSGVGDGEGGAATEADDPADGPATDLLVVTSDARPVPDAGLALTVSPYRVNTHSPLAGVKSISYLERTLAWEEARSRDFDEAVMLNERGEVVSASTANLFWVTRGTLHTPPLSTGAVAGTTRARVAELAGEMGVPFVESTVDLAHLGDADEIFLTSSALGLALVTAFDFHRYTVGAGSVALRLRELFRQLTLSGD